MKCIVRIKKSELQIPEVFVPKGVTAEELLKEMWEKEKVILSSDDDLDEEETYIGSASASVYTVNDNWTDFFIRALVEVER